MAGLTRKGAIRREALLESARWSFTQSGYTAGLRAITENAGVTAMMVRRYFGHKEQIFKEVLDTVLPVLAHEVLTKAPDLPTLCRDIATALLQEASPRATSMDGMLIMLRSMDNQKATEILCRKFRKYCETALVKLLPDSRLNPVQRTAVFLSAIASFQAMLRIDEELGTTQDDPGALAERLQQLFGLLAT
jgi:AcrR family transcriptional regulator